MTIIFESDNDVIIYALEKIISFARNNQYIFLAQSVWWISSIIGLQEGLVIHIDNLKARSEVRPELPIRQLSPAESKKLKSGSHIPRRYIHPERVERIQISDGDYIDSSEESDSTSETDIHNEIINNCEAFLEQSKQERKTTGRFTRKASRVIKQKADRKINKKKPIKTYAIQIEGIDGSELQRRKAAGECQRCAWPRDRKGSHKTMDCFRWKRLDKGTAPFPKQKQYKKDMDLGPYLSTDT
jgi:hypothetical protein